MFEAGRASGRHPWHTAWLADAAGRPRLAAPSLRLGVMRGIEGVERRRLWAHAAKLWLLIAFSIFLWYWADGSALRLFGWMMLSQRGYI